MREGGRSVVKSVRFFFPFYLLTEVVGVGVGVVRNRSRRGKNVIS